MSPRPWLEPLYTADEMRALDSCAIERVGVPSLEPLGRAVAVGCAAGGAATAGAAVGACRRADLAGTCQAQRLGLWAAPGKARAGRVAVLGIGIPRDGDGRPPEPDAGLIEPSVLDVLP